MGRPGPPPKPSALKLISPPRGRRKVSPTEPKPPLGVGECPDWLGPVAHAEWERMAEVLTRLGVLTEIDGAALAAYCEAYSELQAATRMINELGHFIDVPVFSRSSGEQTATRKEINPAINMQRQLFPIVRAYLSEFGLTPASRTRVVANKAQDEADPLQALIDRQRA
jgi:P27 family predicted phage terminase small subunit